MICGLLAMLWLIWIGIQKQIEKQFNPENIFREGNGKTVYFCITPEDFNEKFKPYSKFIYVSDNKLITYDSVKINVIEVCDVCYFESWLPGNINRDSVVLCIFQYVKK
jgi:hypothetical protein